MLLVSNVIWGVHAKELVNIAQARPLRIHTTLSGASALAVLMLPITEGFTLSGLVQVL